MGLERKIAWASLSGPALGLMMWGVAGVGWVPPTFAFYFAIIVGGLGTIVFGSIWIHVGWVWIRARGLQLGPAIVIAFGLAVITGGSIWGAFTWTPAVKKEAGGTGYSPYDLTPEKK